MAGYFGQCPKFDQIFILIASLTKYVVEFIHFFFMLKHLIKRRTVCGFCL